MSDQEVRIRAETSISDPHSCAFVVDRQIYDGKRQFDSAEAAHGSALPEQLFDLGGVRGVWVEGNRVVVRKIVDAEWARLAKKVGQVIRELIAAEQPLVMGAAPNEARYQVNDDERIRATVETILQQQINPGIADHGGFIQLVDVKDGVVSVFMGGGCQGCGAANATLRQGVEVALKRAVPGLRAVVDATDHDAGENPYY